MTQEGTVPLESYRLAQYAAEVPCYICAAGNTGEAELCRQCFAPMALAHQARSEKAQPLLVAALGASGVGKTVYLGVLMDMLSRQPERLHMLARGAFSINLQQATVSALARGEFPAKTPSEPDRWNWVHCQIRSAKQSRPLELIMPDLAGEALAEEVDHPHAYEMIRPLLTRCAGAVVLVDTVKLQGSSLDQDFFAMKLLSYLTELDNRPKHGWPSRPVAVIFTKADQCEECFSDPAAFAEARAPGLWQQCRERLRDYRFFAAGVAGSCAYRNTREGRVQVPLRIEPRGITEPFEWLINRLKP